MLQVVCLYPAPPRLQELTIISSYSYSGFSFHYIKYVIHLCFSQVSLKVKDFFSYQSPVKTNPTKFSFSICTQLSLTYPHLLLLQQINTISMIGKKKPNLKDVGQMYFVLHDCKCLIRDMHSYINTISRKLLQRGSERERTETIKIIWHLGSWQNNVQINDFKAFCLPNFSVKVENSCKK